MVCNIPAATIACPQDLKYRCVERLDGLIDQRCVLREKPLLLFDDGEMLIKAAGFLERPAHLVALRQVRKHCAFLAFMAVDFQAKHAESGVIQAAADNFERGEFLGDKEHRLTSRKRCCNQVRDGLGLAGSRWAFDNQILPANGGDERTVLRAIGLPDEVRNVFYQLGRAGQ